MSKIVIEYDTYFEIKNGLFYPDVPDAQFTFTENLYEPDFNEAPFIIGTSPQGNYIVGFDPILDLSDTVAVTHNPNEEMRHQLTNMSEQELIEYFDRISQEEEN